VRPAGEVVRGVRCGGGEKKGSNQKELLKSQTESEREKKTHWTGGRGGNRGGQIRRRKKRDEGKKGDIQCEHKKLLESKVE